jgi:hypothetical protein
MALDLRFSWVSPATRRTVKELIVRRGCPGDATGFARSVGMRDRYQLDYVLQRDGLLRLRALANWIKIAMWLSESEAGGASLCQSALSDGKEPSSRYRLVKRVTGLGWTQLQARGIVWLLEELVSQCRGPAESVSPMDNSKAM